MEIYRTGFPQSLQNPAGFRTVFTGSTGMNLKQQNRTDHLLQKPDISTCYRHFHNNFRISELLTWRRKTKQLRNLFEPVQPRSGDRIFRRSAAYACSTLHHGLQPWLHSFAAPRLKSVSFRIPHIRRSEISYCAHDRLQPSCVPIVRPIPIS